MPLLLDAQYTSSNSSCTKPKIPFWFFSPVFHTWMLYSRLNLKQKSLKNNNLEEALGLEKDFWFGQLTANKFCNNLKSKVVFILPHRDMTLVAPVCVFHMASAYKPLKHQQYMSRASSDTEYTQNCSVRTSDGSVIDWHWILSCLPKGKTRTKRYTKQRIRNAKEWQIFSLQTGFVIAKDTALGVG